MLKKFHAPVVLGLAIAATVLTGCGGGDDTDDSQAADKYAGTWDIPCLTEGGNSANAVLTLSKSGANTLVGTSTLRVYGNATCSGAPATSQDYPASVTIEGTATVSGKNAEKVTETSFGETGKDVFLVEGNRLYSSPDEAPVDAQGYPTVLDLSRGAVRR